MQMRGLHAPVECCDGAVTSTAQHMVIGSGDQQNVSGSQPVALPCHGDEKVTPLDQIEAGLAATRDMPRPISVELEGARPGFAKLLSQPSADRAIVVVSSINGLASSASAALYSASKAAAISLAKAAALDHARSGIRVNTLALGPFDTPLLATALERQSAHGKADETRRRYESHVAMGRIGRPEEAADAIAWLCSAWSSYMTGSTVILDGGMTAIAR